MIMSVSDTVECWKVAWFVLNWSGCGKKLLWPVFGMNNDGSSQLGWPVSRKRCEPQGMNMKQFYLLDCDIW